MTDRFRKIYKELDEPSKNMMLLIKHMASELEEAYNQIEVAKGPSRELSLALTNLEQSVMWAIKSVTGD